MTKHVYRFGSGGADGGAAMKELLGGKGANLAEMSNLGLPVPPGFTITTEVCTAFLAAEGRLPKGLEREALDALARVEELVGRRFGDAADPLLVSVRSGARVSMPGMMDTVLNLGLNDETVAGLAAASGDERFAWDAYRRFVFMYADVVLGLRRDEDQEDPFEALLTRAKRKRGVEHDCDLTKDDLEKIVRASKALVLERSGRAFPDDPKEQLWEAIRAVFRSWNNERAVSYRNMNGFSSAWGTAVSVVAMVYGNLGEESGTGVAFTRDPATGEKCFYGEYLMNAQGEDVVAGIRTPRPIQELEERSPKAWKELLRIQKKLEAHFRDMQDLEFTIERGKLYMLQCRTGKRTGFAALRIAHDLVKERKITREEALGRLDPEALNQVLQPVFDPKAVALAKRSGALLTRGLNAGPGAATGHIVFNAKRAEARAAKGESVILVRAETSPEDIRGMKAACGILTARGGMTSHAALVARQMGKVCVAGAGELHVDSSARTMTVGGRTLREGEFVSLDGSTGEVYAGEIPTRPSEVIAALLGRKNGKKASPTLEAYEAIMGWADAVRTMGVRTNADQPDQCRAALRMGAEGIGLCRTEHMFFEGDKIRAMRRMILSDGPTERAAALSELLPLQRKDFAALFAELGDLPITIRTLDPPLHEFLPHNPDELTDVAEELGLSSADLAAKLEVLSEVNPMLGHRGCRLGITYPEITRMQAQAIFEAACDVMKKKRVEPRIEIMIPLVSTAREFELQAAEVRAVAEQVFARRKCRITYQIGTMIELPRAALTAAEIARCAEFFSFGTNDLTQTTFGLSRDDAGRFIPIYLAQEILRDDPFASLDVAGVGRLMRIACEDGRTGRPGIKLGICGEHGGDPRSIAACQELGLDYVSCSPYRVPIARLAAAQAALRARA